MAKEPQELKWIESLLPDDYRRKSMFGGFAYYIDQKIVLVMFESAKDPQWNGCLFPVEREFHDNALKQFPELTPHSILPKWLYLPLETEGFDNLVTDIMVQATRSKGFWGSIPKRKVKKETAPKADPFVGISIKMDTRRPRLFSDEPAETILTSAKKISDLKNLGATSEREFQKAGIKTAQKFIQLGWKKTLVKLVKVNPKNRHTIFAYALIGALTNKEFNRITEAEKQEAKDFIKSLAPIKKNKTKK